MIKRFAILVVLLFPFILLAAPSSDHGTVSSGMHEFSAAGGGAGTTDNPEASLSLAPPASDYSMVFLGNLFGVVDGVLHGSGSQIMGAMFSVFNAAVLALGGLVITYTMIVSTLNTAHEGQMLGQKWSSIWIPVRSTVGLALLIPKGSGYCLMQIFVMWVIVQGVGAADKVWEAALSYLNRGGVIIQAQSNPTTLLMSQLPNSTMYGPVMGAKNILIAQVCMLGLQNQLNNLRNDLINGDAAKCKMKAEVAKTPLLGIICNKPIPDFLDSVNFVDVQNAGKDAALNTMNFPNFAASSSDDVKAYQFLDHACGILTWNKLADPTANSAQIKLSKDEVDTSKLSRAIALQQMFVDLQGVAEIMVNNDPLLTDKTNSVQTLPPTTTPSSGSAGTPPPPPPPAPTNCPTPDPTKAQVSCWAKQQFGVPINTNGQPCKSIDGCVNWGSATNENQGVLFSGKEFTGAVSDYNAVMFPVLNLMKQMKNRGDAASARAFITEANLSGWIMAGSYFFDLVRINGSALSNGLGALDTDTGISDKTAQSAQGLRSLCVTPPPSSSTPAEPKDVCTAFGLASGYEFAVERIADLLDGKPLNGDNGLPTPEVDKQVTNQNFTLNLGGTNETLSSTVYAFINNQMMVNTGGNDQPGLDPDMMFASRPNFSVSDKMYYLPPMSFPCGNVKTFVFTFCLGGLIGDVLYNVILMVLYNALVFLFQQLIQQVVMAFIMVPLTAMSYIFVDGLNAISAPGTNPVVGLANMGIIYINFSGDLWIQLLLMSIQSIIIPWFGVFMLGIFVFAMPLLIAWVGVMVSVGFVTSYYVPILPYMIFTFGAVGWLITVVEAMAAAPIVALGVTHPEGHDAFGKGEAAIMLLMNVFLRPALMIIGYISSIAMCYVGVWILNAGYTHAISFMQEYKGSADSDWGQMGDQGQRDLYNDKRGISASGAQNSPGSGAYASIGAKYTGWAGVYAYFFSILLYTTMYLTLVQKSFSLIYHLPDKVLRWIGGSPESAGAEAAQWGDEHVKGKSGEAGKETQTAQSQISKQSAAKGQQATGAVKKALAKAMGGGEIGAKESS
jgi:defect-in-organelle-trafficking protein DotA